jgi:hypothetical protein
VKFALICCAACFTPADSRFAAVAQSTSAASCSPVPDGNPSQAQTAQFDNVEAGLKDRDAQANQDYANDKLRCKNDPKPTACLTTAQKKFQNAETLIQEERNTNGANRQEAQIDAGAARDQCNVTGATPAEKQENLRHFQALVGFQKQNVDIQVGYNNAKLSCNLYSVAAAPDSGGAKSSDKRTLSDDYSNATKPQGCVSAAEKAYQTDQTNLQIATNNENFLHTKNLTAIQKQ